MRIGWLRNTTDLKPRGPLCHPLPNGVRCGRIGKFLLDSARNKYSTEDMLYQIYPACRNQVTQRRRIGNHRHEAVICPLPGLIGQFSQILGFPIEIRRIVVVEVYILR
jgi:hypothetical protein